MNADGSPSTPEEFAAAIQPNLASTPYWQGPVKATPQVGDFFGSSMMQTVSNSPEDNTWSGAVKRAALAAESVITAPFSPVSDAVGIATTKVGDASSKFIKDSADAVAAAGGGVTSGLRWATIIIVLGLALYVFALAAPFLPKPAQRTA